MSLQQTFQRTNVFRDFDLSFSKHPLTKDVGVKTDVNAINQSIKNLVSTNFYERLFQPTIGCNIRGLLFEQADSITISDIRQAITDTITNHEPRVQLLQVVVEDQSEKNSYLVQIFYSISYRDEPVTFNVILERLR
jgi:phage baseplate assembly protein W